MLVLVMTNTPNTTNRYQLKQIGVSLNNYELDSIFLKQIEDNQFILNSFTDNLLTGFFFKDFSFIHSGQAGRLGFSNTLITSFELSGGEIFLANRFLSSNSQIDQYNNDIEFAQFFKLEIDSRWNKSFSKGQQFATRFNFGIATPLIRSQEIPYANQFFVGGPNSMRAWQIRELGPGSHLELRDSTNSELPFYQQGDIKLELNAEYRFDLFWLLEGAFFIDAGNIWTRKNDLDRPGSKFTSRFYEQMAVGVGWGLRFDFSYFIIRFDFGYKLRDPNSTLSEPWVPLRGQRLGAVQVGVNYPF